MKNFKKEINKSTRQRP